MKPFCRVLAICFLFPAFAFPSYASSPSLFFTANELERIEAENAKTAETNEAPAPAPVTLGAILYYGPGNWTVWLQGERWTPATKRPEMRILEVKPGQIRLSIRLSGNNPAKEITLKPYQSYDPATGEISIETKQ